MTAGMVVSQYLADPTWLADYVENVLEAIKRHGGDARIITREIATFTLATPPPSV